MPIHPVGLRRILDAPEFGAAPKPVPITRRADAMSKACFCAACPPSGADAKKLARRKARSGPDHPVLRDRLSPNLTAFNPPTSASWPIGAARQEHANDRRAQLSKQASGQSSRHSAMAGRLTGGPAMAAGRHPRRPGRNRAFLTHAEKPPAAATEVLANAPQRVLGWTRQSRSVSGELQRPGSSLGAASTKACLRS